MLSRLLKLSFLAAAMASVAQADEHAGIAFFETHVRPVLVEHCYQCHSASSSEIKGGLRLDSRPGWMTGGDSGPAIVAGDADASLLIKAVRRTDGLAMPPDEPLPPQAIASLEQWVRMGAPDPRDTEQLAANPSQPHPSDPVTGRDHWAFRPLSSHLTPEVTDANWPRSPIDRFILAGLESSTLKPAPDATDSNLVRRVYYQLTGLPPTPEELAGYLADDRGDRFEQLVDRLLQSPRFGERWGRHWLDLARYADSNGLDENFLFREAWRYRNWVIDAVNKDMPFDQFVRHQIAGDLLSYDSVEQRDRQRIATGFLVIGPKVLLGNDEKRQRLEVADEQLDTIGRSILGQTLGCARCHDHKFDPVPTADYYALAGILTSTKVMEMRFMLNEQRSMERLVGIGPDGESLDEAYEQFWRERAARKEKADRAKSALESLKKDDLKALAEIAASQAEAVAAAARDSSQPLEKRIEAQQALVTQLEAALVSPGIPARAMIATDGETTADEHIRIAGQFDRPGDSVHRGFLQVLTTTAAPIGEKESGRIQLSEWLTDVNNGAGHLAARVLANRIWHHLIGRGLVRTVDNFGRTGELPSHPELLDHLAKELIDSGWSVKSLVREIVLSRTFALSSAHNDASHAIDPDNRLLWRAHRRRLDPESLRDTMLLVAGQLDFSPVESTVGYLGDQATGVGENVRRRTDFHCRSVYLPVIRNDLPELFDVFDFANPHSTTGARPETMVATQGLFLLNDKMVMDAAEATAKRLMAADSATDPAIVVDRMFELIYGVRPSDSERTDVLAFIRQTEERLTAESNPEPKLKALSLACHALFALSRFQFLE